MREFRLLAEQGHAFALFRQAYMHFKGAGVAPDDAQVLRWFRMAVAMVEGALAKRAEWCADRRLLAHWSLMLLRRRKWSAIYSFALHAIIAVEMRRQDF